MSHHSYQTFIQQYFIAVFSESAGAYTVTISNLDTSYQWLVEVDYKQI